MPKKNDNNIKTAEINIKQPTRIDQKVVVQSKSDNKQPVVKKSNMDLLGVDTKLVQKGDKTVGKQGMF